MTGQRTSQLGAVARAASGNFLEMYDFMIFGYYAPSIAKVFFPSADPFASLMLALMTFGAGFLMRPLGALVLGAYIDQHGRRKGLLLTLGLMSLGTLILACLPGYTTIGLLAPLLVLAARLLQGFSAGVELGGISVYLAEMATPANKGFYVSWQSASQQLAVVFAALLGVALNQTLPPEDLAAWGWRVPLGIGCLIIPFLFVLRRSLGETAAFLQRPAHPRAREVWRLVAAHWRLVGLGTMLVVMSTVSFYFITVFTQTFGTSILHLSAQDALIVTVCVGISNFCLLPAMGALSDRVGRKPLLITACVLALATAYPAMLWLTNAPSFSKLLAVELWLSLLYATYNGATIVFLTEVMPSAVRISAFSLAYSLAAALFGGFTPAVTTYLIHATGNQAMPGVWLSLAAASGLIASLTLQPYVEG